MRNPLPFRIPLRLSLLPHPPAVSAALLNLPKLQVVLNSSHVFSFSSSSRSRKSDQPTPISLDQLRPRFGDFEEDVDLSKNNNTSSLQSTDVPLNEQVTSVNRNDSYPISTSEISAAEQRRSKIQEDADKEEIEKLKKSTSASFLAVLIVGISGWIYLGWDEDEDLKDKKLSSKKLALEPEKRSYSRLTKSVYSPIEEKILPDVLPGPYGRPFTLVVELNDSLAHLDWNKESGWRVATRPGLKQFLAYLSKFYEIVIFSSSPGFISQPVVESIDPLGFSMYRLYREHTHYIKGKYIKDVTHLNRDPSKVIVLDVKPENISLQPENGILMKPWKGESGDKGLLQMITVLEELAFLTMYINADDIRPFLSNLRERSSDPYEAWQDFKREKRILLNQHQQEKKPTAADSTAAPIITTLRGIVATLVGNPTGQAAPGNLIDLIETMAKEERKYFEQEQGEGSKTSIQNMYEERTKMNQKMMDAMKGKKMKLVDMFAGQGAEQMQLEMQQLAAQHQREMEIAQRS
ncbi:mitochondrial inner membrane protein required for protein import [Nowakowskiella sp. JEL0078]|nr:mitochondrial inner membrane protein required for protein import [Nowakowskiella sp. JEL0078]